MWPQGKEGISHPKRLEEVRTASPMNLQRELGPAHIIMLDQSG